MRCSPKLRPLAPSMYVLAALLTGCGSAPPPPSVGVAVEADTSTLCGPALFDFQTNAQGAQSCNGPWQYGSWTTPCYAQGDCDIATPKVPAVVCNYKTCANPSHGLDHYTELNYDKTYSYSQRTRVCTGVGATKSCHYEVSCDYSWQGDTGRCATEADQHKWAASASVPDWYVQRMTSVGYVNGDPNADCAIHCVERVENMPVWRSLAAADCGQIDPTCKAAPAQYTQCNDPSRKRNAPDYTLDPNIWACGVDHLTRYHSGFGVVQPSGATVCSPDKAAATHDKCDDNKCLTCDGIGDLDAKLADKATCLRDNFAATFGLAAADSAKLKTLLTIRLKLLLELRGDRLDAIDAKLRGVIEGLYLTAPDSGSTPPCGAPFAPTAASAQCQADHAAKSLPATIVDDTNDKLALCSRLPLPHVPESVRALYFTRCMHDLPETLRSLPASCVPAGGVAAYEALAKAWILASASQPVLDFSDATKLNANVAALQTELRDIDTWYTEARATYLSSGGDLNQLKNDTDQLLVKMWDGLHAGGVMNLAKTSATVAADALESKTRIDLEADRQLLVAAYTKMSDGKAPMTSALLPAITADALEVVHDKLASAILLHDLGCRYLGCKQTKTADEVSDFWRGLSLLHDASALTAFLDPNSHIFVGNEWQLVLSAMVSQHAALEAGVLDAYRDAPALLTTISPTGSYVPQLVTTPDAAGTLQPAFVPTATFVHDINGDGLPDLVARQSAEVVVWYGLGHYQFTPEGQVFQLRSSAGHPVAGADTYDFSFLDANHDGLTDLLLTRGPLFFVLLNDGESFTDSGLISFDTAGRRAGTVVVADLSGSGNTELTVAKDGQAWKLALDGAGTGLLHTADDGKGTVLTVDWDRAPAAAGSGQRHGALAQLTVDTAGLDRMIYHYAYGTPRVHSLARFLLGFDSVTRTDALHTLTSSFLNDDHVQGVLAGDSTQDSLAPEVTHGSSHEYESVSYLGVPWLRKKADLSTWSSADGAQRLTQRTDFVDFAAEVCPHTIQVSDGSGTLTTVLTRTQAWQLVSDEEGHRLLKLANGWPVAAYLDEGYLDDKGLTEPIRFHGTTVAVMRNGAFQLIPTDLRGTVQGDLDGTARLASPFGDRAVHPDVAGAIDYVKKGWDADLGATRMGVRDYDPALNRFWTPDPLYLADPGRCVENVTDCNLYAYAANDPLLNEDPTGKTTMAEGQQAHEQIAANVQAAAAPGELVFANFFSVTQIIGNKGLAASHPIAAEIGAKREPDIVKITPDGRVGIAEIKSAYRPGNAALAFAEATLYVIAFRRGRGRRVHWRRPQ